MIGGVAVLLFGTKKLPELGSGFGQAIANFTKARQEISSQVFNDPLDGIKPGETSKAEQEHSKRKDSSKNYIKSSDITL